MTEMTTLMQEGTSDCLIIKNVIKKLIKNWQKLSINSNFWETYGGRLSLPIYQ